jgi:hypothetical protein
VQVCVFVCVRECVCICAGACVEVSACPCARAQMEYVSDCACVCSALSPVRNTVFILVLFNVWTRGRRYTCAS